MKRLKDVMNLLDYEELVKIKHDLNSGGDGLRILIDNKIKDEIKKQNQFCAVCASKVDPECTTRFSLAFGPKELEKTLSFCAVDCLEYFLNEFKKAGIK